jgi:deazaflavin-dependent oxidoreductase (nitroreductase family)
VPSDLAWKALNTVHRGLMKVSGGRVGWTAAKMTVIELTTTGRKSGEPRTVILTSPVQEGDTIVVVASRGGDAHHPAWYLNLRDDPEVTVAQGGGTGRPYRAEVADVETRARLWPQITAAYKNYAGYQRRTDREIPVVLLNPT